VTHLLQCIDAFLVAFLRMAVSALWGAVLLKAWL
jgi:hypothetical protein